MATKPHLLTIDQLAELFHLPSFEQIEELNLPFLDAGRQAARAEAEQRYADRSYEVRQRMVQEADERGEQDAQEELWSNWRQAVRAAAESAFDPHHLSLAPVQGRTGTYQLHPTTTWEAAAEEIRQTINGEGSFEFNTLREFLASGPYTPRQAVIGHLSWLRRAHEVWGRNSPRHVYEASWR